MFHNGAMSGPIRVSANRRFLVNGDGEPFLWLADTAWPLFTSYPAEAAKAYLRNRARKGFTVIQGVLAWGDPQPAVSVATVSPTTDGRGVGPWLDGDPAHPNPEFFDYIDQVVRFAGEQDLVLGILPTWGYYVTNSRALTTENAYIYGKWLGERYRAQPNLIWINGGDREPVGFEPVFRALAQGLRAGDRGAHLITYHPCGWRSSTYYFHEEDWLDFNMIETWTAWDQVYPSVASDYGLLPTKPVVLGEGAYENGPEYPRGPITPLVVRRQAWWAFMAGGFFTYGQNQMWRVEPGWMDTFDTPGADAMTQFRLIVESRPWWTMIPDQGLFAEGISCGRTLNTAIRTPDRTRAMVYLSSQCHVVLNIDHISTPRVEATWVNPQTGETRSAGVFTTGNRVAGAVFPGWTVQPFTVPGYWEDAVLLLDGIEE